VGHLTTTGNSLCREILWLSSPWRVGAPLPFSEGVVEYEKARKREAAHGVHTLPQDVLDQISDEPLKPRDMGIPMRTQPNSPAEALAQKDAHTREDFGLAPKADEDSGAVGTPFAMAQSAKSARAAAPTAARANLDDGAVFTTGGVPKNEDSRTKTFAIVALAATILAVMVVVAWKSKPRTDVPTGSGASGSTSAPLMQTSLAMSPAPSLTVRHTVEPSVLVASVKPPVSGAPTKPAAPHASAPSAAVNPVASGKPTVPTTAAQPSPPTAPSARLPFIPVPE
jgi:hypothetical protein